LLPLKVRGTKGVMRAAWYLAVTPSYPKREEFWKAGIGLAATKVSVGVGLVLAQEAKTDSASAVRQRNVRFPELA
jgi:hypothetical protein